MNKKTSILSIRISDEIKKELEQESELNGTALNTLVSQVLTRHTEWDRFAKDMGFIFSTRKFLKGILESVSVETVQKIASTVCKDAVKEVIKFSFSEITFETFVKTIRIWLAASDIPFRFIQNDSDVGGKFIVQHELGEKYSFYLKTMSETLLHEIGFNVYDLEITPDNLSFRSTSAQNSTDL